MKRVLLVLLVLLIPVAGVCGELKAAKYIFPPTFDTDGEIFALKATNKKHTYFFYSGGNKIKLVVNKDQIHLHNFPFEKSKLYRNSDNEVVYEDASGNSLIALDGTLFSLVFDEIMAAEQEKK